MAQANYGPYSCIESNNLIIVIVFLLCHILQAAALYARASVSLVYINYVDLFFVLLTFFFQHKLC